MKQSILNGKFNDTFSLLYKDVLSSQGRFISALDCFIEKFGEENDILLFSAPGRVEIGGNHTDHQRGFVLTCGVDQDIIAVASKNYENKVNIFSEGFGLTTIFLDDLSLNKDEYQSSAALIKGVLNYFKSSGFNVGGFNAYFTSNVAKGSGLSSSAAFELLICSILNGIYNDGKIEPTTLAKISQKAESEYFGKPCGLMDQMASAHGGFLFIDFENPDEPNISKISADFSDYNHTLCIVNSGSSHSDLTSDYADITIEMKNVANYFGKEYLREITKEDVSSNFLVLREMFGDRAVLRSLNYFDETNRANLEAKALEKGDFNEFLRLVNQSGIASFCYLQNVYSNQNVGFQDLSLAIFYAKEILNGRGAVRVHGGGFAGTVMAVVPNDILSEFCQKIENIFGDGSVSIMKIRSVGACEISKI